MTECYACSKLAELRAENNALRVKCDKQAEVLDLQQELIDECDVETTTKSSEKDGNDSREKLEADVLGYWHEEFPGADKYDMLELVCGWRNRQAAITERNTSPFSPFLPFPL